jgi:hypothetical protein
MNCFCARALTLCFLGAPGVVSASTLYSLTTAEEDYSFLGENVTLNKPPSVTGNVGIFSGGLFTLSSNTLNGEVDFQGTQNDSESGTFSVTGGEFSNVAQVGTAQSDAQTLAVTIAGLSGTPISDVTSSQTFAAGVYDVSNINLGKNAVLTINASSASDQFVFRISGTFTLGANAQIVFTGPVNPDNVLFYYTGGSTVDFGGSPTLGSVFQGILLDNASSAQDFVFDTHTGGGASDGRAFNISGGSITFSSGTWDGTPADPPAPEPATWILTTGGLALLARRRYRNS